MKQHFKYYKCKEKTDLVVSYNLDELRDRYKKFEEESLEEFNNSEFVDYENHATDLSYYFKTEQEIINKIHKRPFTDSINKLVLNMRNRINNIIYYTPKELEIMYKKPLKWCGMYPLKPDFEKHYKDKYLINDSDLLFQIIIDYADNTEAKLCVTNWSKPGNVERWHAFRSHYLGSNYTDYV